MLRQDTDMASFFEEPQADIPALFAFLTERAKRHGWDAEQVCLHVEGATITHLRYGKRLAVKYVESLL